MYVRTIKLARLGTFSTIWLYFAKVVYLACNEAYRGKRLYTPSVLVIANSSGTSYTTAQRYNAARISTVYSVLVQSFGVLLLVGLIEWCDVSPWWKSCAS